MKARLTLWLLVVVWALAGTRRAASPLERAAGPAQPREHGAGLKQRGARVIGERVLEHPADGDLASAAWSGDRWLPSRGLSRIAERVRAA